MSGLRTVVCVSKLSRSLRQICLRENVAPLCSRGFKTENVTKYQAPEACLTIQSRIVLSMFASSQNHQEYHCPSSLLFKQPFIAILDQSIMNRGVLDCPTLPQIVQDVIAPEGQLQEITEPLTNQEPAKEAKNILKIRRRKMNRHLLKKFRKRMLFTLRKQRQRMRKKKQNIFNAELLAIKKRGQNFDAEQHIRNELEEARRGGFYINILAKDSS